MTVAMGDHTYGVCWVTLPPCSNDHFEARKADRQALNCHPASPPLKGSGGDDGKSPVGSFRVGVSEDRNKKCRRTMEDAHSFVYDYAGVRGQGYFAVFEYVCDAST